MIKDLIQPGDFALVDSNKTAPKIIKYLMRSYTIWQDLWRMVFHKLEIPLYYHAVLFIDKNTIIEQQSRVQEVSSEKLLNTNNNLLIVRVKALVDQSNIVAIARTDMGRFYGVVSVIAKTLTWITGIPYFARYLHYPRTEICINRVCDWIEKGTGEKFGAKTHLELTTHTVHKYVIDHPEKFEIIYQGVPRQGSVI